MGDTAQEGGREKFIREQVERRQLSGWQASASFYVSRFVIRTLRVASGVLVLLIGLWAGDWGLEALGTPFAAQSFLGLIGGIGACLAAIGLVVGAFSAAFGEGESRKEFDARRGENLREEAERVLRVQQEALTERLTKEAQRARRR